MGKPEEAVFFLGNYIFLDKPDLGKTEEPEAEEDICLQSFVISPLSLHIPFLRLPVAINIPLSLFSLQRQYNSIRAQISDRPEKMD